jgi:hypothetical protein
MAKTNIPFKSQEEFSEPAHDNLKHPAYDDPAEAHGDWKPMESAPMGGLSCFISNKPEGEGTLAFYKRTKAFKGKRWEEIGKWVDHVTGADIAFKPVYWRERFKAVG